MKGESIDIWSMTLNVDTVRCIRREGNCLLHSGNWSSVGNLNGELNTNHAPRSPSKDGDGDRRLPLVKIPTAESIKDINSVMWASSPDHREPHRKPFHRSNGSESPSFSESGSDIYSKREVIQKLRQQLKRHDEMIMEMQSQITDLQNSLSAQTTHSDRLQAQLDSANQGLLDSDREIQRLRKVTADYHVAEAASPERCVMDSRNLRTATMNGGSNGYLDGMDDAALHCVGVERGREDVDKVETLKTEVGELKEVIEGKEFLIRSYKGEKVELSAKVRELQLKLASHVPNILFCSRRFFFDLLEGPQALGPREELPTAGGQGNAAPSAGGWIRTCVPHWGAGTGSQLGVHCWDSRRFNRACSDSC